MRIGLFHGYELTGSGSNEYTRYLAASLVDAGHEVHVICREENPEALPFVSGAFRWTPGGDAETLFRKGAGSGAGCFLHQLPHGPVRPVFLTDKQREGNVKSFTALTDGEIDAYRRLNEDLLHAILSRQKLDALHANHLVFQPVAALRPCRDTGTPLIIYPHGSAIEYTVKRDERYRRLAWEGLSGCSGMIVGNREVQSRILGLYPEKSEEIAAKSRIVGVGVDTSLFKPVARGERRASIERLAGAVGDIGGKGIELETELIERLRRGDYDATQAHLDQYDHSLPDRDLHRKLEAIPWQGNIVLFVGSLTVGKGLQSLITAMPMVLRESPSTTLVVVGSGAYREVLEALVHAIASGDRELLLHLTARGMDLDRNELTGPWEDVRAFLERDDNLSLLLESGKDLDRHVVFLGRLDHSLLRFLFPCADAAVFPSVVPEAYPLVVMESLANGVLPLVTDFSGFSDSITELESFLGKSLTDRIRIPRDDAVRVERLASNLASLLGDAKLREASPVLRRIAEENFDWKLRAVQMARAYGELAGLPLPADRAD